MRDGIFEDLVDDLYRFLKNLPVAPMRQIKGDRDIVTDNDFLVETWLSDRLRSIDPTIPIVAEESWKSGPLPDDFWTIDPIDGTLNYATSIPLWASAVSLNRDGEPVWSAVVAPQIGLRVTGDTARQIVSGFAPQPPPEGLRHAVCVLSDVSNRERGDGRNDERRHVLALAQESCARIRILGSSALAAVWTASGAFGVAFLFSDQPWDRFPAIGIARASGLRVLDTACGILSADSVCLAHPNVMAEVMEALTMAEQRMA